MEGPPPQHTAKTIDDYLEHLSKGVFQAGISWRVVEAKWATIKPAFHRFKAERVARMTDREIDALAKDERVVRSRPKIAAIVHNAGAVVVDLAQDQPERFRDSGIHSRYEALAGEPVIIG
jgi:3-methyladenine DNA glycosylase Tag